MREEFFATYDVMTGIRIAATLGGFFLLMVFLIVYKSRSHSHKALKVSFFLRELLSLQLQLISLTGSKDPESCCTSGPRRRGS